MIILTIDFEWKPVLENESSQYVFPNTITVHMRQKYRIPAIYRWIVESDGRVESIYIGETEELCPRRVYGYLNPGPSQMTNIRINEIFTKLVDEGRRITLEMLIFKDFSLDGKTISMSDLDKKTVRVFLEHMMLVYYENSKEMQILNMAIK